MGSFFLNRLGAFQIMLITVIVALSFEISLTYQQIYAQSNNDSAVSTLDDLVNKLVTGVKLENIITSPGEVHVGDTFEVNATVINTLPLNITFIAGNCNSDFSTVLFNNVEETMSPKCMNKVLPTILQTGDKTTVQESSGTGKQYKAVAEGQAKGNAILLYGIEVIPEGSSFKTSLLSQVVQPFEFTILP